MKSLEKFLWVLLGVWLVAMAWPASYWMRVDQIRVLDSFQGEDFELVLVGGPTRRFSGSYQVTVRNSTTLETPSGAEHFSGVRPYDPDAVVSRPDPITISWWGADVDYGNLEPGNYIVTTCWTVHGPFFGLVPNKTLCVDSNVFIIVPTEDKPEGEVVEG